MGFGLPGLHACALIPIARNKVMANMEEMVMGSCIMAVGCLDLEDRDYWIWEKDGVVEAFDGRIEESRLCFTLYMRELTAQSHS